MEFFTENDRVRERAQMLNLVIHPPLQKLEIRQPDTASAGEKAFLEFFETRIWPVLSQRESLGIQASALHTILDRALYNDEAEKQAWMQQKDSKENEAQKLATDPQWQNNVKIWAGLSQGLTGDLADFARRIWEDIELGEFSEKERPLLERLTTLSTQVSNLSNTSEFVPQLAPTEKAVNDIIQNYFEGKRGFQEAWTSIETFQKSGRTAHGQDVATKGRALLQEAAEIRTKLARSKGYDTWADYVFAQQARHYAPGFKTADDRIRFLRGLLSATKAPYLEFLKKRLSKIPGMSLENLRRSQLSLIQLQDETLVRKYFPLERIEGEWKKAMLASGFTQEALNCINLDGYPRPQKYTHAYMNNVASHGPRTLGIKAPGLKLDVPPANSKDWYDAHIYIVQNYRDDGPHAWNTAWHEGGHAMDYVHQEDILGYGAAYGYTETHSMTMERFFDDIDYLMSVGRSREGEPLPRDLAEQYILHSKINGLTQFRTQAAYALYDILLWKHGYESGQPQDFVDRAKTLFEELTGEASQAKGFTIDNVDWRMSAFATSHFYGGGVRYFGYIVADMAAQLTAEALWDKFEKESGRRSLLNQPRIASLLQEAYYRRGFLQEFPKPIEAFTGKPFSPESIVRGVIDTVGKYQGTN